jgi:uncharacterized SAM-binding protein YcdF (DUF218 family)
LPAKVLVVEGWIDRDGIRAARTEFDQYGYQYIVTTGLSNHAEMAAGELIRLGVPTEKIVVACATETEINRTYESAVAAWRVLEAKGIHSKALNVFTWGPHARRSRLVFAKVTGMAVGVVSWTPSGGEAVPWWRSSDRAKELLTETAGYVYEVLLNSGRRFNSRGDGAFSGALGPQYFLVGRHLIV